MKKTNVALFHSATRWLRYLPLLLCFIVFGSSDLAAQYKSQEEASISVKGALEQVIGDLSTTNERVDQVSASQKQTIYTFRYYTEYLTQISDLEDTEEAMLALDKMYPVVKLDEAIKDIALSAREDLMNLITE
jgi:hypothetical protein